MDSITRKRGLGKAKVVKRREALRELSELGRIDDVDVKVSLIQRSVDALCKTT